MVKRKATNTEVDAYTYINQELEKLGWIVKNPARVPTGEVYKQNEVLASNEFKKMLNQDRPEAVVILNSREHWVIESKRDKKDIDEALDEAKNQYAEKINKSDKIKCVLISGVAGNDTDGFIVKNQYLKDNKWHNVLFNEKEKNILLSKEQANYIISNDTCNWNEFPDLPEEKYISVAIDINEILHNAGINKNKRARFLAGLILSMAQNSSIDLKEEDTTTLIGSVNGLIKKKLREVEKENFFDFLKLELPPTQENHIKYRKSIVEIIKELQTLDIQNAMASGKDILGEFYEKFLKYGNGAKEIGIVLTPRHITEFAVDVLSVTHNDFILDPTCGTGGFLVAGFDYVKKQSSKAQTDNFKDNNIFGIEQDDEVVALALVNMIFRGDGKNKMKEGNCFQNNIDKVIEPDNKAISGTFAKRDNSLPKEPIITKVLMNPPFALKKGDEKERDFIDYALSQIQEGGLLFAIIPISVMVEGGAGATWRKELLANHTILSAITLSEELFYPVSVGTIGLFLKKGIPHDFKKQNVYFARATTDGYRKKKGIRVKDKKERNQLKEIQCELKAFIHNQNTKFKNVPEFKKICKLDKLNYEIAPETYIDSKVPNFDEIEQSIDQMCRNGLSYLIQNRKILTRIETVATKPKVSRKNITFKFVPLFYENKIREDGLCISSKNGTVLPQNALEEKVGGVPYVTTSSLNNGISGFFDIEATCKAKCLTVALNGSVGEVFFQFEDFVTSGDNAVLSLKNKYNPYFLFYIAIMIRNHQWRYNYYRKLTNAKLQKLTIPIPYINKNIALNYIKAIVKNSYGYDELKEFLYKGTLYEKTTNKTSRTTYKK